MMRTKRSYYEILGLPETASAEQIKRKYRQLVRKFHPDVAPNKETAHQFFILINEAYDTLTDPAGRREYDARLVEGRRYKAPAGQTTSHTQTRQEARGKRKEQSAKYLREAQWSFIQRRFKEAASHCRAALRVNPGSAQAHAILGDIFRAQGKVDQAISEYTYALQCDPADLETERKLARLLSDQIAPGAARPERVSETMSRARWRLAGWSFAVLIILLIPAHPVVPAPWLEGTPFAGLSANLIGLAVLASFIVGIMLAVDGLVAHPERELYTQTLRGQRDRNWLNTALLLMSPAGFVVCGAAYLIVGYLTNSLARSVTTTIAATLGVTAMAALLNGIPGAGVKMVLFGGNVCFWAILAGAQVAPRFIHGQERKPKR